MKKWFFTLLSLLVGIVLSYFMYDSSWLLSIGSFISRGFLTVIPLASFGILSFFIASGVAALHLQGSLWKVIGTALLWAVVSMLIIGSIIGFLAFLMPIIDLDYFLEANGEFSRLLSTNLQIEESRIPAFFETSSFYSSFGILLPILLASALLGYALTPDKDMIKPAYSVVNSLSEVMYRLSSFGATLATIGLAFITGVSLSYVYRLSRWDSIMMFLVFIFLSLLILVFLIFPILIVLFTKEKTPFRLIGELLAPLFSALLSGTMVYAIPSTVLHMRRNLGIAKRVNSLSFPMLMVFARFGSGAMSSLLLFGLMSYSSSTTVLPSTAVLIVIVTSMLSFVCFPFSGFEVLFIALTATNLLALHIESNLLIATYLLTRPFLQAVAAFIDLLVATLGAASCGYRVDSRVEVQKADRM